MFAKVSYANLSLLKKVLLPYVLLLLTLAMAISFGSGMLLNSGLLDISQKQLLHVQKQAYDDFKNIERLMSLTVNLSLDPPDKATRRLEQVIQPYDNHITAAMVKWQAADLSEQQQALLEKSRIKGSAYITVQQTAEHGLVLTSAQPVTDDSFTLLFHPLGNEHLDRLAKHYTADFFLLDQQGEVLIKSGTSVNYLPKLSELSRSKLLAGESYSTIVKHDGERLIIYTALPLGHDTVFLLATSQSLADLEALIGKHRLYLLGIIGLSLLICITLYRSLLLRLFSPLGALMTAYDKVAGGDDNYRIAVEGHSHSQLVKLCNGCNQLLDRLSSKQDQVEELSAKLHRMQELKEHNRHLRKSNLELEARSLNMKEQNQELSALFKVTQTMVSSLDQKLLYERIIQALKDSLNCPIYVLYILQPAADHLVAVKAQGIFGVDLKSITVELGDGQAGMAAINQQPIYLPDLSKESNPPNYGNELIDTGSMLSVPLAVQNRLIGVLNLHQKEVNGFSNTAQQIAQAIASQAAIAIENARLYEKTKALSATDELTGLSNRRQFQEYLMRELAQSRRQHNPFSILMIDIDHFKLYNDYHGHLKGDIVLKKVASLLVQNTRGVDLVARFGGEEFVLLLPKSDKASSLSVAEKLRLCVEQEFFPGADQSQPAKRLTISIGVSFFPGDSSDIYDLMNLADTALYEAKKQGRNTCVGWAPNLLPAPTPKTKG